MLSLAQVEVTDAPVIKAVLDYVPKFDKRYESLYAYYFGISPEENHNFHVTVLAKVLKQKTADKKDIYQYRLTKVQRKDLYKLIITKDLLFRNKTDNKILKDYLRYHASFDFTRDEMKELVKVYAR